MFFWYHTKIQAIHSFQTRFVVPDVARTCRATLELRNNMCKHHIAPALFSYQNDYLISPDPVPEEAVVKAHLWNSCIA